MLVPFAADLAVPEAESGSEYLTDVRAEGVLLIDGTNKKKSALTQCLHTNESGIDNKKS